jgi:glycosyltransferase involved in cell wall biosynthesis
MRNFVHEEMSGSGPAPLLLHVFPTFAVGGAQLRMAAFANRFGPAFRHAVIALDGVLTARARLAPALEVSFPSIILHKGDTLGSIWRCRAALAALRPDVLVTHNWGAIEWAMGNALVGRPHVHIEDGFGPEERARQLPRRVLTRRLVLRRATVVLPSRTLWRIAAGTWRLPARGVRYIPNGIDLARFAPGPESSPPPWPRDLPVIGTLAALRPEKNLGRLLHAFALLRAAHPARLVIVGDGVERAALTARAAALGIAEWVTFAGATDDPPRAYRNFDVFALSSDTEQMPLSVLEAMGCALPVAATDVGDVAAMLAPANRPYVVAPDAPALAAALAALLAAPAQARALGAANRARAERDFDQETMFAAYAALFAAACGRRQS